MFDQENVREFVNNDREMVTDLRMSSMDWVGSLKHVFVHMLLHFFLAGRLNRQVTSICIFFHWRTQGCYFRVCWLMLNLLWMEEILHQLVDGYAIIIPFFTVFYSYQ